MNTSGRFLKRICERVKKLDILAPEVGLSVQGDSGVKSYIGVMLSFACIGLFVGAATYGTINSLRTDQPSVVQQTSNSNVYPTMDLIKDKKFPAIMLYTQSNGPIVVEQISRYVTIAAAKQSRQFVDNDPNKEPIFKTDIIPMIPCRQLSQEDRVKLGGPTSPIEVAVFNNNALCPDLSKINFDVTVSGKTSDTRAEDMFVLLYPCVPALAPGGCASLPEVASTGVLLLPNLMNIDLSNYKEPITQAYNTDQDFSINPSFVQQVTTRLKMVEVWNSNGMFTEDTVVVSQSDFDTQRSQFQLRNPAQTSCTQLDNTCQPYMLFQFSSGGTKISFTRGYKGALEIIGDIGGIRDIIFTLGFYLYVLYNDREVKKRLVSSVYNIDSSTSLTTGNKPLDQAKTDNSHLQQLAPSRGCCKKKQNSVSTTAQQNSRDAPAEPFDEDEAYEQIEKNLDVVNLIRKLNFIEVLLKFFRIEDDNQLSCVAQASYSLGRKGTQSAMSGQRVVGVGLGIKELISGVPGGGDTQDAGGSFEIPLHFQSNNSSLSHRRGVQAQWNRNDETNHPIFRNFKPRDELMKELMTFITAQSAWADKYSYPDQDSEKKMNQLVELPAPNKEHNALEGSHSNSVNKSNIALLKSPENMMFLSK